MASIGGGCRHCQSHGGYGLARLGIPNERVQALWDYESSPIFSDAERAAYRFAFSAGVVPNAVTPQHHADLREYYTNEEIAQILLEIAMAGFLNRWNDSLATVTDQESVDWATENLSDVGWSIGKHAGAEPEQRLRPEEMRRLEDEAWRRRQGDTDTERR